MELGEEETKEELDDDDAVKLAVNEEKASQKS